MGKKQKKEKVYYVDDGRTVADMSGLSSGPRLGGRHPASPRPKAKDVWNTYWNAVKMMFVPMLTVICGILVVYMVLTFIFMLL